MQGHVLSLVFFLVLVATPTSALGLSCSTSIVLSSPAARRWRSPGRDVDGAEEAADEQPSASPSAAGSPSTSGPLISLPRLEASLAEVRTSVSMIHKELLERAAMSTPRPRAAHAAAVSSSVVAPDPLVNARSDSGVLENCMEVVLSTLGGILSGGPLGYIFGFGSAVLSKNRAPGATGPLGVMKAVHMKGWESAAYWAGISAAFAGFGTAAEVIRGKEDMWNNVLGSCGTGAAMCRQQGPRGMAQGCASYALLTYMFEKWTGASRDELDFVDIELDADSSAKRRRNRRKNSISTSQEKKFL